MKKNLWRGCQVLVESSGRLENEARREIRARTGKVEGARTRSLPLLCRLSTTACGRQGSPALASWHLSLKSRVPETSAGELASRREREAVPCLSGFFGFLQDPAMRGHICQERRFR